MEWAEPHPQGTEHFLANHPRAVESRRTLKCRAVRQDTATHWGHCKTPARWLLDGKPYCSVHADIRLRAFHVYYGAKS